MWRCAACGALLHVRDPILCVNLSKQFCILVYDPREATRTLAQTVDQKRAELLERYPDARRYVPDRMIVLTVEEDAVDTLRLPADVIDEMIEGQRKANGRRGKYRSERVSAMCVDYDAGSGKIILQGYEISDELLHNPDYWDSEEAKSLRSQIMTFRSAEASSPDNSISAANNGTEVDADALRHELMELAHEYRYSSEMEGPLPFEYGLALQIGGLDDGKSEGASDTRSWPKAWLGPPLRSALEGIFGQAEKASETPDVTGSAASDDAEPEPFAGIGVLSFDWKKATIAHLPEDVLRIAQLLNQGIVDEAFERAEIHASNAGDQQPSIASLMYCVTALKKGYAFGPTLTIDSINSFLHQFNAVGSAESNALSMCAYAYRQLARYEAARGSAERVAVANYAALQLYWTIHSARNLADLGPEVVSELFTLGRTDSAAIAGYRLLRDEAVVSSMHDEDRIHLLSSMSLFERPQFNVVMGLGTGQLLVQKLDFPNSVDASHARVVGTGGSSGNSEGLRTVFILRLMDDENRPKPPFYRSVLVGSQFLNSLINQLCMSTNPTDRMRLTQALLNVQLGIEVPPAGLVTLNALLLKYAAEAVREDPSSRTLHHATIALALSCSIFVHAASEIDERCVKALTGEDRVAAMADVALWLAAERTGRLALRLEQAMAGKRGLGHEMISDFGSVTRALVASYPLALETLNRSTEAVQVYRELLPLQERQRAEMYSRDIHLLAQGWMKEGYVRLSRCLFTGYLLEGDLLRAVQAGDALEAHKARRTRERLFDRLQIDVPSWISAPLLHVAARLSPDSAIACLGIHPHTERIPGRWMLVCVPGSTSLEHAWASEVTPGESLEEIYEWFRDRMSKVSQEVGSRKVAESQFSSVLNEIIPETEVRERLLTLGRIIQPIDENIRMMYLSTEHYAFQLPWAAALRLAAPETTTEVSVVPSCIFAIRGQAVSAAVSRGLRGAVWCWGEDPALERAGQSMVNEIYSESETDAAWSFSLIDGQHSSDAPPLLDLLVVLSHGSKKAGIDISSITDQLTDVPRIVLLLGCWSAFMEQHNLHMEIEGAVTELLERGTELVIASVWPVPLTSARQFGTAYALALSSGMSPREAFSMARDLLSVGTGAGSHPAVWAGLTLFG
jgi:hypothetical protein